MTCGTCGLSWDDAVATDWTPVPSGRCPFEYFHLPQEEHSVEQHERDAVSAKLGYLPPDTRINSAAATHEATPSATLRRRLGTLVRLVKILGGRRSGLADSIDAARIESIRIALAVRRARRAARKAVSCRPPAAAGRRAIVRRYTLDGVVGIWNDIDRAADAARRPRRATRIEVVESGPFAGYFYTTVIIADVTGDHGHDASLWPPLPTHAESVAREVAWLNCNYVLPRADDVVHEG